MRINQIMTKNLETLPPNTSIQKIAEEMEKLDCGFMPITENEKLVGVVTDRDIVLRVLAKGKDPHTTQAKEVMTQDSCCCVRGNQEVEEAADEMCKNQIRRLVVTDENDKICGVLSLGDIATRCKDPDLDADIIESVSEEH
jgi:CBS domain-containing protein